MKISTLNDPYRRTATIGVIGLITAASLMILAACTKEADDVNKNLSTDADNFKIVRTVVFVNGITDKTLLEITGKCSVDPGDGRRMTVLCKTDSGEYLRHALGQSDNVFWFYRQEEAANVSKSHYRFTVRPESLIPAVTAP